MTHYTFTLTGAVQRLSDALPNPTPGGADDIPYRALYLQPDGANANAIVLGGSTLSATNYGMKLPAGASGVPPAPLLFEFSGEGPIKLSHLWVLGTAGEKLRVLGVPF